MDWLEVTVLTTTDGVEFVCAALMENGVSGVQIDDAYDTAQFLANNDKHWDYVDESILGAEKGLAKIVFYVEPDGERLAEIKGALDGLSRLELGFDLGELSVSAKKVNDGDWLENWKKYYKPFRIGERVVVKPIWEGLEEFGLVEGDVVFNINPGHVFGTGLHQSTALCVEVLEKVVKKGNGVLDIGTGSGILGIVALLLGAGKVVATDIDEMCAKSAKENAGLNGVLDRFEVFVGNVLEGREILGEYDVVCANIIADVIADLSPIVPRFLKEKGIFISSGIIEERKNDVLSALAKNGLEVLQVLTKDDWVCVVAQNA